MNRSRSIQRWIAWVTPLVLSTAAIGASATPIAFPFTATINWHDPELGTAVTDGTPVHGRFVIDSDAPNQDPTSESWSHYLLTHVDIAFGTFAWSSEGGTLSVANDIGIDAILFRVPDQFFFPVFPPSAAFEGPGLGEGGDLPLIFVRFDLWSWFPESPLADTALPLSLPTFSHALGHMIFQRDGEPERSIGFRDIRFVPEPGTAVLGALGLGTFALHRARWRLQR